MSHRDLAQGLSCTFVNTGKYTIPQFWYVCKTCTKPNAEGKYTSGCCASCAAVCHKDHELVMRHDKFYCDCGDGTLSCSCKLYKAPEPIKLPKEPSKKELRTMKYCRFNVKPGIGIDEITERMIRNQQSHFLITNNPTNLMFPWIDMTSETVVNDIKELTCGRARSCEIDPSGERATIYTWSDSRSNYVNSGSYDLYLPQKSSALPKEPSKEDLKNLKYRKYYLKPETTINTLIGIMTQNQQSHYLLTYNPNAILFPWIDKTSEIVCDDVDEVSSSNARSSEIDPCGEKATIFVWSDSRKEYINEGSYDTFIQ